MHVISRNYYALLFHVKTIFDLRTIPRQGVCVFVFFPFKYELHTVAPVIVPISIALLPRDRNVIISVTLCTIDTTYTYSILIEGSQRDMVVQPTVQDQDLF